MLNKGQHPKPIGKELNRIENAIRHRMTKRGLRSKRARGRSFALAPRTDAGAERLGVGWQDRDDEGEEEMTEPKIPRMMPDPRRHCRCGS
jgi:hypothetical protein